MRVRCPICHKKVVWKENPYRPFCSERCKLIDLGEWASEHYRFAGETSLPETDQKEEHPDEGSENGDKKER